MTIWQKVMVSLIALGCMLISWYLFVKWMLPVHFPELYYQNQNQSRSHPTSRDQHLHHEGIEIQQQKSICTTNCNCNKRSNNRNQLILGGHP